MFRRFFSEKLSPFRIIILSFLGVIFAGALLLALPAASNSGHATPFDAALFTSTSSVCVTGLVVRDTATYWSPFGQAVILVLIQIGGIGIISIAAAIAAISGRKISLMQRSVLQESISTHQIGGIVKLTEFIIKGALIVELVGALVMMPAFCGRYGLQGIWMSVFHSISAFCNAGFDIMGNKTGAFSSLTWFADDPIVVIPIALLIIIGGIGFLTWDDIVTHKHHVRRYRLQSKVIIATTLVLILVATVYLFIFEYDDVPLKERILFSFFQAVTPRTAGFNTTDLSVLSDVGKMMIIILMLIGGSPGSTAGGMKTTTLTVLVANARSAFRKKKSIQLFGRRIEDVTVKNAATLLMLYLILCLGGAAVISMIERLPLQSCLFETASAVGTVGLSLGLTPGLGAVSRLILITLMFIGRVGGLTLIYAAAMSKKVEVSQCPMEKINIG